MIEPEVKKSKKSSPYSEADLCAAFIAAVGRRGPYQMAKPGEWIPYPETGGFDILLVRPSDGLQIGVEAKLVLNPHVIAQALPGWGERYTQVGPDHRAALVPYDATSSNLQAICSAVGVRVIRQELHFKADKTVDATRGHFHPELPRDLPGYHDPDWHHWGPASRVKLPEYVPEVPAGVPSPRLLNDWTIRAIRLAILLEERPISRRDLAHLGLAVTNWVNPHNGWLERTPRGYVWRAGCRRDFQGQFPRAWEQIRADRLKWDPPTAPVSTQAEQPIQQPLL